MLGFDTNSLWNQIKSGYAAIPPSVKNTVIDNGLAGLAGLATPLPPVNAGITAYRAARQAQQATRPKKPAGTKPASRPARKAKAAKTSGLDALGFRIDPSLNAAAQKMGGYTDTAMGEMRNNFQQSQNMLRAEMSRAANDPMWTAARKLALENARNPGLPKNVVDRMHGRAAARSAASTAAAMRGAVHQAAKYGSTGAAKANALQLAGNRGAINRQNAGVDIDKYAAEIANRDKNTAVGQLASVAQGHNAARSGPMSQLINLRQSYNPLNWMQQTQQIMSPLNGLGQGVGMQGAYGQLPVQAHAAPALQAPPPPTTRDKKKQQPFTWPMFGMGPMGAIL